MLGEQHREVQDAVRRFATDVIRPIATELDETERFPAEVYAQMAGLGLFGIDGMHALVHLVVGLAGIFLSRKLASARGYLWAVGVVFAILAVMGFADSSPARRMVSANARSFITCRTTSSRNAASRMRPPASPRYFPPNTYCSSPSVIPKPAAANRAQLETATTQ